MNAMPGFFREACTRLGIELDAEASARLQAYVSLLVDWNTRINLISRKDTEDIWRRHVLHSVAVLSLAPVPTTGRAFDLGSGGGLPGLPLAILRPAVHFTLCDATGKKIRAVEEMAAEIGLANVHCIHARVEDLAEERDHAGKYAAVFARAVTALPSLLMWSRPLLALREGGMLIAWKGGDLSGELRSAAPMLHGRSVEEVPIAIPGEPWFTEQDKKLLLVRPR